MALSCGLHVVVVFLLLTAPAVIPVDESFPDLSQARIELLTVRVPERLYLPARRAQADSQTPAGGAEQPAGERLPTTAGSRKGETGRPQGIRSRAESRFELAELWRYSLRLQTVLQPMYPPDLELAAETALPQVIFWSAPDRDSVASGAKRLVVPGRRLPAVAPDLHETPQLQAPKADTDAIANPDQTAAVARSLEVHPGPRVRLPLRTFQPPSPTRRPTSTIDILTGDPIALLTLNPKAPALDSVRSFLVSPGNQLAMLHALAHAGSSHDAPATAGQGNETEHTQIKARPDDPSHPMASPGADSGRVQNDASARSHGETVDVKPGDGAKPQRAPESSESAPGVVTVPGRTLDTGLGAPAVTAVSSEPPTEASPGKIVPIRVEHPVNGVFDLVVQSAGDEGVQKATGLLDGPTIYTVYVRVGGPKEWILQYCTASERTNVAGRVVQLGSPAALRSPYPKITVVPPPEAYGRKLRIMVRASLTASGDFERLRPARPEDVAVTAILIPFLKQWQFRPATQDGKPVGVETLLVIPPSPI